jgi:hypothetical protein
MSKREPKTASTISPRPNILWRLFVLTGLPTMAVLSINDDAWARWEDTVGDAVPRERIRALAIGTAAVHVTESAYVYRSARRSGVPKPARWALATLVYGFPVLGRLRKAKRAAAV